MPSIPNRQLVRAAQRSRVFGSSHTTVFFSSHSQRNLHYSSPVLRSPVPLSPHEKAHLTSQENPPNEARPSSNTSFPEPNSSDGPNPHSQDRSSFGHGDFYKKLVPAMIPVAILASAVYMGLKLTRTHLSHERYAESAQARIDVLEKELEQWREKAKAREALIQNSQNKMQPAANTPSPAQEGKWWALGLL